jgi:hypothetical protein
MQFEMKINLDDLNSTMLVKVHVAVKTNGAGSLDACTVVDLNERTEYVTVGYRDNGTPTMVEIPIRQIELIEFDSFYNYRGVSARTFILE